MRTVTLGCVPYINAIPLIAPLRDLEDVKVIYDHPSALPALLDSGVADAILVSSFEALTQPNRFVIPGICIGSEGPVKSVRLFSKIPFAQIRSLCLDSSSLTSNALAQILLAELFDCRPSTHVSEPELEVMLQDFDAAVLIGDVGMAAKSDGLHVLDLGEAFTQAFKLPFVWATWTSTTLRDDLNQLLDVAIPTTPDGWEPYVSEAVARTGWHPDIVLEYFTKNMRYPFDSAAQAGLNTFGELISKHGLARPEVVLTP